MAMIAPAVAARAGAGKAAASKATTSKAAAAKAGGRARAGAKGSAAVPAGGPPPASQTPQMANEILSKAAPAKLAKAGGQVAGELGDAARSLTLTPPSRLSAKDASGFAFGLIAYAIVLAGIKYGPAGVRGWISAKFVNKPMTRQGQPS